jgi:hypothetical protein
MVDNEETDEFGEVINKITNRPKDCIDASRILKNLFLGSYEHAASLEDGLKLLGITHVLSIGNLDQMPSKFPHKFQYLQIELDDAKSARIENHFEKALKFIKKALETENNNVLVHCWAGVSRSATIIMAYLIKHYCLTYTESFETVRKARHWVSPNQGFREKLKEWAVKNNRSEPIENINLYQRTRQLIHDIYEDKRDADREDRENIISAFEVVFGDYHQHTLDIKEELMIFY